MYIGNVDGFKNVVTIKSPNSISLNKKEIFSDGERKLNITDFSMYLGHTQAPTSSKREYDFKTSHPFSYGNWMVAHNGVLTNFEQLKPLVNNPLAYNEVDTSIIPALLDELEDELEDEIQTMSEILSKLKGTFGLWLYCKSSGNTYLARSGSTLYGDYLTNDFSSLPYAKFQPLQEGIIYLLTREGITEVGFFSTNSPFLAL
jgi:glucosamine 6-phosphate synthetase-like amidotransferase/phosphosugar isomerase protein